MMLQFVYGWFYYGFYFMMASALVTLMLNRVTKKLWLPPLIINGISVVVLLLASSMGWITKEHATYAMYFNYMPLVFASMLVNGLVFGFRNLSKAVENKLWGYKESASKSEP